MSLKNFRLFLFITGIFTIALVEIAFSPPQDQTFTIDGRAVFNFNKYANQKVIVTITEDGKPFKTVYSDDRGKFTAEIFLNHKYMFNMSMDYHGTSRVYIDTHVPESVAETGVGGYFEFNCPLYELYEGLNMGVLNRPLMKMKYLPKKDKFEFDKEYSENMRYDLEGFTARSDDLKMQNKKVLKSGKERKKSIDKEKKALAVAPEAEKKERKVIEFEAEKEDKKAINKRGHRNIMEVPDEEIAQEVQETEEVDPGITSEPVEEVIEEDLSTALNVAPKRILIEDVEAIAKNNESEEQKIEEEKNKLRQVQSIARVEEENKMKDEVRSLNRLAIIKREKTMANKKIQTERLRYLIKTIALAEIFIKKEYYQQHPINHNELIPSVIIKNNDGWWVDQEKILVRFPNESVTFTKTTYPFGITYYYMNEKEIDRESFCSSLNAISKNNYSCIN